MPSLHVFLLDQALSMDITFSNYFISLGETYISFVSVVLFIPHLFHHITMFLHQLCSVHTKPFQPCFVKGSKTDFLSNYEIVMQRKHCISTVSQKKKKKFAFNILAESAVNVWIRVLLGQQIAGLSLFTLAKHSIQLVLKLSAYWISCSHVIVLIWETFQKRQKGLASHFRIWEHPVFFLSIAYYKGKHQHYY